jgi:hypothetical protein
LIEKRGKDITEFISDADNYALIFPVNASLEDRALLLCTTLFMDYRYFEASTNNSSRNGIFLKFIDKLNSKNYNYLFYISKFILIRASDK